MQGIFSLAAETKMYKYVQEYANIFLNNNIQLAQFIGINDYNLVIIHLAA